MRSRLTLPNASTAIVEPENVRDYLLSTSHPVGRFKATFFRALGFSSDDWEALRDSLLDIARTEPAVATETSTYGQKFEVRATLKGPAGRSASIVAVWIVRTGETFPRFVTAFPA